MTSDTTSSPEIEVCEVTCPGVHPNETTEGIAEPCDWTVRSKHTKEDNSVETENTKVDTKKRPYETAVEGGTMCYVQGTQNSN